VTVAELAALHERMRALDAALDELHTDVAVLTLEMAGEGLTDAERRLVPYVRGTLRTTEIARELRLSPNTIKTQVAGLYRKLGVNTRAAARQGLAGVTR
jgi:DNA-binding CsgD family transcriptional regulator